LTSPPATPLEGQRYLVAPAPTGVWAGKANQIAAFQDGAWAFYPPLMGWLLWVSEESSLIVFDGTLWISPSRAMNNLTSIGVNASADLNNRLTVASPATLFNHAGSSHQIKINKALASHTASIVFQTGFSGRAEIGLQGADQLGAKVSANGTDWVEGFALKPTGEMGLGTLNPQSALHVERIKTQLTLVETDTQAPTGAAILCALKTLPSIAGMCLGSLGYGSRAGAELSLRGAAFGAYAETNWVQGTSHPAFLRFDTSGPNETTPSERMRIAANGNVAIGLTSPSTRLHVNGPVRVAQYTLAGSPNAAQAGAGAIIYISDMNGGGQLAFSDGTSWRRVTDRAVATV
jgi:Protein of unknown function (DUF2793)